MDRLSGPALVLDQDDCVILARQLAEVIRLGYTARGRLPPAFLLGCASEVSRVARSAVRSRADMQAGLRHSTGESRVAPAETDSDQPVRLTIRETAELAQVCESLARRWCRRGDVQASRGPRGAWEVEVEPLLRIRALCCPHGSRTCSRA